MENKISVSIILPTYNVQNYIKRCLVSISKQTYSGPIECLIIDDCGTDKSISIVREFIKTYRGSISFQIISLEKNSGLSAARNVGILQSKGDYLYFLDSDDWIEPFCIEGMVGLARKYSYVDIVQAGAYCSSKEQSSLLSLGGKKLPEFSNDKKWIKKTFLKRYEIPITAWNKLLNRNFIIKNNLFFFEGIIHEDEDWNWFLAKYVNSIAFYKFDTYHYITRNGSIMTYKLDKSKIAWIKIINHFIDNIDDYCRGTQELFIYDFLVYRFLFEKSFVDDYKRLFFKFMNKTSGINRVLLYTIYNRTCWKILCKFGLNKQLDLIIKKKFSRHDK